jgi:integrase
MIEPKPTWQLRDLRAKAGTDTETQAGMGAAKDLLGHAGEEMTRHYIRHRAGKVVKPTR